jgi:antitoxin HicB
MLNSRVYKAIIHPEEEGGYWAEVPSLPGCFTQGKTLDEIKIHLHEAITLHLECMLEEGEPLPIGDQDQEFVEFGIAA